MTIDTSLGAPPYTNICCAPITNSFDLLTASVLKEVDFDVQFQNLISVTSVDWYITATPFGTPLASGIAAPVTQIGSTFACMDPNYPCRTESISLPSVSLGPGAYWLELINAVAPDPACGGCNEPVYWDESDGLSQAVFQTAALDSWGSESFTILGDTAQGPSVPEPSSLTLIGLGLLGLGGIIRRKRVN